MLSKKKLHHKIFLILKFLYLVRINKLKKNKMIKIILKILVKIIKGKTKSKMIGIFHRMISKMNGNGLRIQILKKMKINLKFKRIYNNRKTSKLKETKIC
jgi:DNA-binding FadR family transcriptional regulator